MGGFASKEGKATFGGDVGVYDADDFVEDGFGDDL